METDQNELAARFLLGKLTDEEHAAVEENYFHDAIVFEDILIAENSLTDAYVSDRLSPEDRVLFEKRLLINPRQRQRAAFAETLIKYASSLPVDNLSPATYKSRWAAIFALGLSVKPLLSFSFAAGVLILLVGAALWWISSESRRFNEETLARANKPDGIDTKTPVLNTPIEEQGPTNEKGNSESSESNTNTPNPRWEQPSPKKLTAQRNSPPSIISTIILPLGSTRGTETAKAFVVPEKTNLVNLQLRFEDGHFASYFVVIETADGQQVWRGKVSKSTKNNDEKTVSLAIPASLLRRGDYIITLKGLTKEGIYESVADYSFTINRR